MAVTGTQSPPDATSTIYHIRIRKSEKAPLSTSNPASLLPADTTGVELIAKFFRALGDPSRLRLLEFLLDGERTVSECVTHIGLSQGRVSTHLACLAECGYVGARRHKRFVYYAVIDPRVAELVELVRLVVADNAAALTRCMRIDG